jgi:sugar phosphate isomerase/epimerase
MADLEQKRRTVRVLELLDESFQAHARGDGEAFRASLDAATELDAFAVSGIQGGMTIGEIPNPERDWAAWTEYVQVNRDALAEAERTADEGDGGQLPR